MPINIVDAMHKCQQKSRTEMTLAALVTWMVQTLAFAVTVAGGTMATAAWRTCNKIKVIFRLRHDFRGGPREAPPGCD